MGSGDRIPKARKKCGGRFKSQFKENVLVASIFRDGAVIIPHGDDIIKTGDAVVVVTKQLGLQDISDVLR